MDIITKIDNYIECPRISESTISLLEYACFEDYIFLNEGIFDSVKNALSKMGINIVKTQKGLIDVAKDAGKKLGTILVYAYQAAQGKSGAVARLQTAIEETNLTPGDVIDFLLKVDMITFGILAIPIRQIEALTGWNIAVNVNRKLDDNYVIKKLESAIIELEEVAMDLTGQAAKALYNYVKKLKDLYDDIKDQMIAMIKNK